LRGLEIGELTQWQTDILRQGHRTPQRPALIQDTEAAHQSFAFFGFGAREVEVAIEDLALGRFLETDQMAQDGAFATSAATHHDKDVAAPNNEIQIAHQYETAIRHCHVANRDRRLFGRRVSL
jgi:hypothetical protein